MAAPPYMKFYVADYLADTTHINVAEHGAYLLILMSMWQAGGHLPAADANLSRIARCDMETWNQVKPVVLGFFKRSGARLTHKRLTAEIAKFEAVSAVRSAAGRSGVAKKAMKNSGEATAKAVQTPKAIAKHLGTYPDTDPDTDLDKKQGKKPGQAGGEIRPAEVEYAELIWPHVPEEFRVDREKGPLVAELRKAIAEGIDRVDLVEGTIRYYEIKGRIGGTKGPKRPGYAIRDRAWTFFPHDDVHPRTGAAPTEAETSARAEIGTHEQPGPRMQRAWMESWIDHEPRLREFHWKEAWGPAPGKPGCRVAPEIQREYGINTQQAEGV